jgi:hypothetical protein
VITEDPDLHATTRGHAILGLNVVQLVTINAEFLEVDRVHDPEGDVVLDPDHLPALLFPVPPNVRDFSAFAVDPESITQERHARLIPGVVPIHGHQSSVGLGVPPP